jgi:two-component system, LytTR family, response regulator
MIISCIIIEDEPPAAEKLAGFIGQVAFLKLTRKFSNAIDAIPFIKENKTDLIFLDIQMKHLTGIQFLETLPVKPAVIITTAYSEFALKGYELNVSDYLLKPYSFERFMKAVTKVYDTFYNEKVASVNTIFVKNGYALENINIDDILYIEGQKEFLRIITCQKKVMTLMNFKSLLDMLPDDKFIRVHKSYAVSVPKIESIERNRIKIAGQLIPIGDTYRDNFYKAIMM